jgi:hypothetical protein
MEEPADLAAAAAANGSPPAPEGWRGPDARGRFYVPAKGRSGVVYRQGEETPAQALERDAKGPRDTPPKRKSKPVGKKQPAPAAQDLKTVEAVLSEALSSPALIAAMMGDEWAANHFTVQAPHVARNLVVASTHNPWLRAKLETMAAEGSELAMMKVITMLGVAGALVGYAVPPMIWWLNLPVPPKAREMFGIPDRREHATPPAAPTAAPST